MPDQARWPESEAMSSSLRLPNRAAPWLALLSTLGVLIAGCESDPGDEGTTRYTDSAGETLGDGDGDPSGDGDGEPAGDGDGEPAGDGDGEPAGDGDGEPAGDGDGDPTGDGDGDGDMGSVTEDGSLYTISVDQFEMVVDAAAGARIVSFEIDGYETLVQMGAASQYGSTFWPSPQSWGWPPSMAVDTGPYVATLGDNSVSMVSADDFGFNIVVTKTFTPVPGEGIRVTYAMENIAGFDQNLAGWEITRLAGGLAFYEPGPAGVVREDGGSNFTSLVNGHRWYAYPQGGGDSKHFADGTGWLAGAIPAAIGGANLLVLKQFEDVAFEDFASSNAGQEAEIELYGAGNGTYYELEQQGPAEALTPGASSSWDVLWSGAVLDEGANFDAGSQDLLDAVAGLQTAP